MNKLIFTRLRGRLMAFLVSEHRLLQAEAAPEQDAFCVGAIYVGKVKNIVKNLNAAFIEYRPGVNGYYPMERPVRPGDEFAVQVSRAAVKTKDAVLTTKLELTGRYAVVTAEKGFGISSKIKDKRWREELKSRWESREVSPFGLVVRTNAYEAPERELWEEYDRLCLQMEQILSAAPKRVCGSVLYKPPGFVGRIAANAYGEETEEIVTDLPEVFEELTGPSAQSLKIPVRFYDDPSYSLAALYHLETSLNQALGKTVWLKSGGYLVIEPTEAMTVIDVNSGKNTEKKSPQELYLKTNLEAAAEIAVQLRLRNYSGIIIVDFIDLKDPASRETLLSAFRKHLSADPVKTVLVDMTALGLVEITRKKLQAPLHEQLAK